jgi:uncharacterized membrane protein YkoI
MAGVAGGKKTRKVALGELPPAVARAIQEHRPNAEIDKLTIEKKGGIVLYDIEFKGDQGEIEVAEDGMVIDIVTIVEMKDIPPAAAAAIQKAAVGAKIRRLEKSEVRAEIKKEKGRGRIVVLETPKYVYEAELVNGSQRGEVEVAADGSIVEALKWTSRGVADEDDEAAEEAEG